MSKQLIQASNPAIDTARSEPQYLYSEVMSPVFSLSCSCVYIGPHDGPQAFDAGVKVGLEENRHQMSVYLLLSAER